MKPTTPEPRILTILAELREHIEDGYRGRLQGVYLYGSHARGDSTPESDIDILIVLDTIARYSEELERISHITAALSLEHDASISTVLLPLADWLHRDSPFLVNLREHALAA